MQICNRNAMMAQAATDRTDGNPTQLCPDGSWQHHRFEP